ncbi:MAG: GxxExxY protein [Planctomycetes bacterium]|nr:GxxExxY protein [Planctomycetota bacterium]
MDFDELSNRVIGCALEVHRHLGPGLLESTYDECLAQELDLSGIGFKRQWPVAIEYKGRKLHSAYRIDFLVEEKLIVELKSIDEVAPIHEAQLLTYMRHAGVSIGLLINFNTRVLKDGIRRFVL